MRRAALIDNPKAGQKHHARQRDAILAELRRGGFEVEVLPTTGPGVATQFAREIVADGRAEVVFAFGGDGTVREVAAGLIGSEVALGILPGGTVNLLARALGLPGRPDAAAAALVGMPVRSLDVGLAGASPFLMMVSAGFDAQVLRDLDHRVKRHLGQLGIFSAGLREWWRYPYPEIQWTVDGRPMHGSFMTVANIPLYGGPFRLVPSARPDDGRLDLLAFHSSGRWASFTFVLQVVTGGRHVRRRDVSMVTAEEVVLEGPPGLALQVDGDVCGEAFPVRIRLAAERLRVLAP